MKYQNQYIYLTCRKMSHILVMLALIFGCTLSANAQTWQQLNDQQRAVLAPLEEDWASLTKARKKKWLEVANHYPKMSDAEQSILKSRMTEWAKLSTVERQVARDNYLRTLKISPEKKAAAWETYQQLSDEDKKKLADKKTSTSKPTAVTSPTLK
jgi:hypothetical protein